MRSLYRRDVKITNDTADPVEQHRVDHEHEEPEGGDDEWQGQQQQERTQKGVEDSQHERRDDQSGV